MDSPREIWLDKLPNGGFEVFYPDEVAHWHTEDFAEPTVYHYLLSTPKLLALIAAAKAWSETKPGDDVQSVQIKLHEAASEYARAETPGAKVEEKA